ncbi:hypothetical protein LL946_18580 [Knoellia locipacati]|uniref:hypothetical protein n=1 Tax=Knoellia locipacati TaxID=882824 RepID=UPI00384BB187
MLQRGPSGDPSAPEEACFPGEKAHEAALAGWDAVVLVNRHVDPDDAFCGSGAFVDEIVAVCSPHEAFHLMFNSDISTTYPEADPAIDTFAIPEAHDPANAFGLGDLWVHEVATDPLDPSLAYLSYYSGGLRSVQIQCTNPADTSTCGLVEVGGHLDPEGNNFWGVQTFVRDGETMSRGLAECGG